MDVIGAAEDFENLAQPLRLTQMVSVDRDDVTNFRANLLAPLSS